MDQEQFNRAYELGDRLVKSKEKTEKAKRRSIWFKAMVWSILLIPRSSAARLPYDILMVCERSERQNTMLTKSIIIS